MDAKPSLQSLQKLPQVDKVLRHERLQALASEVRRDVLARLVRAQIDLIRQDSINPAADNQGDLTELIVERVVSTAEQMLSGGVLPVVNGTGVILNTNLGRAPLPKAVIARLQAVASGYSSLEIELESGKRGERTTVLDLLITTLTGAEAALVVNNCAAAVMLAVCALAADKEVVVSRGELVEIGGSFRLPDVIQSAGGILKEVGTTNRTRLSDYEKALGKNCGLVLKCHQSNFQINGFTEEADLAQLAKLCKAHGVPLAKDLGSGAMIALSEINLRHEPTPEEALKEGLDLVMFSGDKLLGGVQSGVVIGSKQLIARLRNHPMYRALRPDKLIIALLESVFAEYLRPDAASRIPALAFAAAPSQSIKTRVDNFIQLANKQIKHLSLKTIETKAAMGGGTLPGEEIDSFGLALKCSRGHYSSEKLAQKLRLCKPSLVPIVVNDQVVIDFRTVAQSEEGTILEVLRSMDG